MRFFRQDMSLSNAHPMGVGFSILLVGSFMSYVTGHLMGALSSYIVFGFFSFYSLMATISCEIMNPYHNINNTI